MIRTRRTRASRAMVLALLASAAAASVARADTYTWNGKGDSPNWDDPFISPDIGYANWAPFGPHLPGNGDDVIFGTGFVSGDPNLDGSRSVNSLTIDTSSSFSIVGNPGDSLAIFSGNLTRTAASSGTQTFAAPVLLGNGPQSAVDLSLEGTGSVVFSGGLNIQSGTSMTKTGTADMIVSGATSTINTPLNVTSGNFIVNGATVQGNSAGNYQVQDPGSSIIVKNGGTLSTAGSVMATNGATIQVTDPGSRLNSNVLVGVGGQGTLNASSGGEVSSGILYIGENDGGNGVVNIQGGTLDSTTIELAPTGHASGTLNLSGSGTTATAMNVYLNGRGSSSNSNPSGNSTVNIDSGASLETSRLSLFESNAVVNVNAGSLIVDLSILGDPGTAINLQADPAGGHALVINAPVGIFAGNITGAGSLILTGTGGPNGVIGNGIRVVLEGENTYTGATVVQKGDLQLTFGSSNSSAYDVQSGGQLDLGPAVQEVVNLGTGTILSEPGGEVDYEKVLLNGGLIRGAGKNIVTGSDSVVFNGTTIGADATVSTVAGTGTPTFNQVTVAGNLLLNSPLNINASTIASSGRVDVNSGSNVTAALLASNGTVSIHSGGAVTNTAANLTLSSGSITTLDNGGALTLANATALDLRGGLLTNNGTISGPVNVYFGSVAKGSGTYSGTLNVFEGGRVSPGNSPGTLTSTASAWNQGGIYHWDIADLSGPAGAAWDLWNAGTTSITPTGSFEIEIQSLGSLPGGGLQGWNPSQPYSWLIATADNGAFSADALSHLAIVDDGFADTNSLAGGTFSLTDSPDGNNLYMTFSPAPEPASFGCIALFASGMLLRRKRHCL